MDIYIYSATYKHFYCRRMWVVRFWSIAANVCVPPTSCFRHANLRYMELQLSDIYPPECYIHCKLIPDYKVTITHYVDKPCTIVALYALIHTTGLSKECMYFSPIIWRGTQRNSLGMQPDLFPNGCIVVFPTRQFWICYVCLISFECCKNFVIRLLCKCIVT